MKDIITLLSGVAGAILAHFFGPWDALIEAMIVFMFIDMITGTLVAAWFKLSDKSPDGRLLSKAMWQGMAKKGMALFFVIIGNQFDLILERDYVRSAVIFCVLASELLSIIENAGAMGVPIPAVIKRMLTTFNERLPDKIAEKAADDIADRITGEDKKEG